VDPDAAYELLGLERRQPHQLARLARDCGLHRPRCGGSPSPSSLTRNGDERAVEVRPVRLRQADSVRRIPSDPFPLRNWRELGARGTRAFL
jgi:hypothetical protein